MPLNRQSVCAPDIGSILELFLLKEMFAYLNNSNSIKTKIFITITIIIIIIACFKDRWSLAQNICWGSAWTKIVIISDVVEPNYINIFAKYSPGQNEIILQACPFQKDLISLLRYEWQETRNLLPHPAMGIQS